MSTGQNIQTDTRELCLPEGRRVGQPGHEVARRYLLTRLGEIGLRPFRDAAFELPYTRPHPETGVATGFVNLVGVIPGRDRDAAPLLVGAHYDSVIDAPCADDNATAVAVTLAVAEALVDTEPRRDVVIAIFDAEEPPFFCSDAMGSTRFWLDHCRGIDFGCVLIMDLIGHDVKLGLGELDEKLPHLRELLFVLGAESHAELPDLVQRVAPEVTGLRVFPTLNSYIGDLSDHHAFREGGQPFLFLTCGRGRYYHDPSDTPDADDWINFDKVHRVCELVERLLRELDTAALPGGAAPADTVSFEVAMIEKAIGPKLPQLLQLSGQDRLETRADIDRLVAALAGSLLSG